LEEELLDLGLLPFCRTALQRRAEKSLSERAMPRVDPAT
jgi:hypothetical protein